MAQITAAQVNNFLKAIQEEFTVVSATLKEKGYKRFQRALVVAFLALLAGYYLFYIPQGKKIARIQRKLDEARSLAQYTAQYKDLKERLNATVAQMPPMSSKDRWLTNTVLDTMKAENIMLDSIVPPEEVEQEGFVFQRITISVQLKFMELAAWLARVEGTKPVIRIGSIDVTKNDDPLGTNKVNCEVGTVIPLNKAAP